MKFKFKIIENLSKSIISETHFVRGVQFLNHFNKHVAKNYSEYFLETADELFEPMSPDEYDQYAHRLSQQPVYTSDVDSAFNVVGFVGKNNRLIKYNKLLSELVVYVADKDDAVTISYYKLKTTSDHSRYRRLLTNQYVRELEPLDDFYNR